VNLLNRNKKKQEHLMNLPKQFDLSLYEDTHIQSVTLYHSRATVERIFSLSDLNVGRMTVVLHAASNFCDIVLPETLHIDLYDIDALIIDQYIQRFHLDNSLSEEERSRYSQNIKDTLNKKYKSEEEIMLEEQVLHLERQKDHLKTEISTISSCRVAMNETLIPYGIDNKKSSIDLLSPNSWKNLENFLSSFSKQIAKFDQQIMDCKDKLGNISLTLSNTRTKLAELRIKREEKVNNECERLLKGWHIGLVFDVNTLSQSAQFHIRYQVKNCSWCPLYDFRINGSRLNINYFALIWQETGEDWKEVKTLYLSTIDPSLATSPKPLNSNLIFLPTNSGYFSSILHIDKKEMKKEIDFREAFVSPLPPSRGAATFIFKVDSVRNLPSGNIKHKVLLSNLQFDDINRIYYCIPKLSPNVYVKIRSKNLSDIPIMKGSFNLFDGNRFIGMYELDDSINYNEDFEVYMGYDPLTTVEYTVKKLNMEKNAFLRRNFYHICVVNRTIKINNKHSETIYMNIVDQIPISEDKKIIVQLLTPANIKPFNEMDIKSKNVVFIDEHNNLEWNNLEINSQSIKELSVEFTVKYPRSLELDTDIF
jgi:uncharacterized protein (TIGR02231 family)